MRSIEASLLSLSTGFPHYSLSELLTASTSTTLQAPHGNPQLHGILAVEDRLASTTLGEHVYSGYKRSERGPCAPFSTTSLSDSHSPRASSLAWVTGYDVRLAIYERHTCYANALHYSVVLGVGACGTRVLFASSQSTAYGAVCQSPALECRSWLLARWLLDSPPLHELFIRPVL